MNECLMTPQHEKQIGYWVSEKGKCIKFGKTMFMFVDTNDVLISLVRQCLCLWIRMM